MKTIIEFKDGHVETLGNQAPCFEFEEDELSFIDENMVTDGDTISISLVKKVIFEND